MNKLFKIIFITLSILIIIFAYHSIKSNSSHLKHSNRAIQKNISSKIIRLHVIGNSNFAYDQTLKLKIKNAIINKLQPILHNVNNQTYARKIITNNLTNINKIAQSILKQNNSTYIAKTTLSTTYFPTKQYGDMTLPEGVYESVCVKLGSAKGKNWWCVLYPTLCFVDSSYGIIPPDSKDKLKNTLTPYEYNYIMNNSNTKISYQSAIYNFLKNLIPTPK